MARHHVGANSGLSKVRPVRFVRLWNVWFLAAVCVRMCLLGAGTGVWFGCVMRDLRQARLRMVDQQIVGRGITRPSVLEAMRTVPREVFVSPGFEEFAYEDSPLPIGEGQTISQPYIVALMADAAEVEAGDKVLEVGAGSGYAAAVFSRIAVRVFAIERHAALGDGARRRLAALGYDNVDVRVADGSRGWPEAAPFDAIIVSAGSPDVPEALKLQLSLGGRLVIPVGDPWQRQRLKKIMRRSFSDFDEEDLGGVMFVPLVGASGDQNARSRKRWARPRSSETSTSGTLSDAIRAAAEPLPSLDDATFGRLFDRFADCRVVLLGEATHGTSEFYRARARITEHLVTHHGFTIVAVEADWPDAAVIDRYVRHLPAVPDAEPPFQRFPTWMWRNTDVAGFIDRLRRHNAGVGETRDRVGFHGLDLYSLRTSIAAVLEYLDSVDPAAATVARERYGCLTPWEHDPSTYGRAVLTSGYRACERAVVAQCRDLLAKRNIYSAKDGASFLDAAQNARLVAAAEHYYRAMYYGGPEAWNLRDRHMFETLNVLLDENGPAAKAVVWAHNSHIGDARFTEMGLVRNQLNVGQLCRERFGADAALIGFATHTGEVAAARHWGGDVQTMRVSPSHPDSYERLCHDAETPAFLLDFSRNPSLGSRLVRPRLERFIGVIYRPEAELVSHYAEASLAQQFDAFVWFDETTAVTPLATEHVQPGMPETYPFGL